MSAAPIEITGLARRFRTVDAVADATFSAAPARVTGFLGPNGAGKSTTLRMLLGLIRRVGVISPSTHSEYVEPPSQRWGSDRREASGSRHREAAFR